MSVTLTVNNTPFAYPSSGDEPGWGGQATGWAEEVTLVLGNLLGPSDILETAFNIANNQTTVTDVTGLTFDSGSVRSSVVQYSVYRISDSNPSGNAETGEMHLIYDGSAATPWSIAIGGVVGNAGINFSITNTGQVQYTSTDIGSSNYQGLIKFNAKAISQ